MSTDAGGLWAHGSWAEMSGTARDVVQAQSVHGGVHFHGDSARWRVPPRQLLADPAGFVNRVPQLAELDSFVGGDKDSGQTSVAIIDGTAGVGKTALALHWAHSVIARFPDGQLYINLRGYDPGAPLRAHEVLERFLKALAVERAEIPDELDERAALFRSHVAGRRMLIILDNAVNSAQVRPLLPGTSESMVLVTSRNELRALVAREGARRIRVDVLPSGEAVLLLKKTAGTYRDGPDDPTDLAYLAGLCARLPLALRIAAERMASRPHLAVHELIDELRDESQLWDALSSEDETDADAVRSVFAWSYRALAPDTARFFRILGLHPAPEFGSYAAAALAEVPCSTARRQLGILLGAHLVEQIASDRYQFHDLLRAYAADQSRHEDSADLRSRALQRVTTWYAHTAKAASQAMATDSLELALDPVEAAIEPLTFADHTTAQAWFDIERSNLVVVVGAAAASGLDRLAWMLSAVLLGIYEITNTFDDWFATSEIGLAAARRLGDRYGQAVLLESLGKACAQSHKLERAIEHHRAALRIRRDMADRRGQARSINALGLVYWRSGRLLAARDAFEQAGALAEDIGDQTVHTFAIMNLGGVHCVLGRFDQAVDLLGRVLPVLRAGGQRIYEENALQDMSAALRGLGRLDHALVCAEKAVQICRDLRNQVSLAPALRELALTQRALMRPEDALSAYREAAEIQQRIGDRAREAIIHDEAGQVCRDLGRMREAADHIRRAAALYDVVGDDYRARELEDLVRSLTEDQNPDS